MDYICSAEIVNNSHQTINVSVKYDRGKLDSLYEYKSEKYLKHFQYINEASGLSVIFDTVNLISNFIIPAGKKLEVSHTPGGWGVTPDYSLLKEIRILWNNKITLYNNQSFDTAFKRKERGLWELVIR